MKERLNQKCWDFYLYLNDTEMEFLENRESSAYPVFNKERNVLFMLDRDLPEKNLIYITTDFYGNGNGDQVTIHVFLSDKAFKDLKEKKIIGSRYGGPVGSEKITVFWGEPDEIEDMISFNS